MMRNWNTGSRGIVVFLTVLCGLLLIVNVNTPLSSSDYFYRFFFNELGQADDSHPISGIGDFFHSLYNHFFYVNGRIPVHVFVQFFVVCSAKWLFNILNPLFFCCYVWLISLVALRRVSLSSATLTAMLLLLLMPLFHAYYCWMAGSVNYLWSSVLILFFLCVIRNKEGEAVGWHSAPLLLLAFFAGWTHEGISLPIAVALMARTLLRWKHVRLQGLSLWMAVFFLAGAVVCTPGALHRSRLSAGLSGDFFQSEFLILWNVFTQLRLFYVFLLLLAGALLLRKVSFRRFLSGNFVWIVSVFLTIAVIMYAQMEDNLRMLYLMEMSSLIMSLRLLEQIGIKKGVRQTAAAVSAIACIGICAGACYWSVKNFREFKSQERQIRHGSRLVPVDPAFRVPEFWGRYVCEAVGLRDIASMGNPASTQCRVRAAYYGVESLSYTVSELTDMMHRSPESFDDFTDGGFMPCYLMRLADGDRVGEVLLHVRKADRGEVPFPDCLVSGWLPMYSDTLLNSPFSYLSYEGTNYVCIPKIPEIDGRMQSFEVTIEE